jgi:hypothetical protein
VAALRVVQARIDGTGVARRVYALSCLVGVLGLAALIACVGVMVARARTAE